MRVFISWSGARSEALARALKDWLKKTIFDCEAWVSIDLQRGVQWNAAIHENLERHELGILCVTPENMHSPWLNYEAGALSMHLGDNVRIIPYLLAFRSLSDLREPFAQYNACLADEDGTYSMVATLNAHSSAPRSEADLKEAFNMLWPQLRDRLRAIPKPATSIPAVTADSKLDELLITVRRIEAAQARTESYLPRIGGDGTGETRMQHLARELSKPESPISLGFPLGAGAPPGYRHRVTELVGLLLKSHGVSSRWTYPTGSNYSIVVVEEELSEQILRALRATSSAYGLRIVFRNTRDDVERATHFGSSEALGRAGQGTVSQLMRASGITLFYFGEEEVFARHEDVSDETMYALGSALKNLTTPYRLILQEVPEFLRGLAQSIEGTT